MALSQKQLKKLPYQLLLLLLTTGASLILGFLSFGGMFALWPVLPLAFSTFVLSVAYEGEIYLQNIRGALSKLFKSHFLERQLGKQYLLENFPDTTDENCPQFFKDYEAQLHLLHKFSHKRLDSESRKRKKHLEKTLKDMEKWFAKTLFLQKDNSKKATKYELELKTWLKEHDQKQWHAMHQKRSTLFSGVKAFSALSGIFMGLGTTYLLVETFSTIPLLAAISFSAWPLMIVPMAVVAGAAYGLLTYNAITDIISNDTLKNWYSKIRENFKQGITPKNVFMAITATFLVAMAITLTFLTAGTWWTVAKEAKPLFQWMAKMPSFIMGVINPLITGISSVVFNLQNTSETLSLIDEAVSSEHHEHHHKQAGFWSTLKKSFGTLHQRENLLQMLNPFRLLAKLTFTPIRILLFLGHLISIAVTADRVPGISQIASAILGFTIEALEDGHYFIPHNHHHHKHADTKELLQERLGEHESHSHDNDLPTRFLKWLFSPILFLAATWDYASSQLNQDQRQPLTWSKAWKKQMGYKEEQSVNLTADDKKPSQEWQREHAIYRIERHMEKQLQETQFGREIAQEKCRKLTKIQCSLAECEPKQVSEQLKAIEKAPVFAKHRFFNNGGKTATTQFLEELPERISSLAAAG